MSSSEKDANADEKSRQLEVNCWRRLRIAAYIALAVHLVAGLAMVFILRQGLDTADLGSRLTFLTESRSLWTAGWFCWNLAAFSILYFYVSFADAHRRGGLSPEWILRFAVFISVAAVACDLVAESIEMGVLPDLAQWILASIHLSTADSVPMHIGADAPGSVLFLAFHRAAMMMTGYVANGLYTVSAALLLLATRHEYSARALTAGTFVVMGGTLLSLACILNSVPGMVVSNVLLLPALLLWLAAVGQTCRSRIIESECQTSPAIAIRK